LIRTVTRLSAPHVYLTSVFLISLSHATMFTTYVMYYVSGLGLNPLQLVLVGTFLEATIVLCEVPTGVVADTYGRRISVITGYFVIGAAFVLKGTIPFYAGLLGALSLSFFAMVVICEIARGVGETFLSGAYEAWITDEVGEAKVGALFLRGGQLSQVAWLIGIGLSVGLAHLGLSLPYLAGGLLYLLVGAFMALAMRETGFQPVARNGRSHLRMMADTLKEGLGIVRARPLLAFVLAATVAAGAASEGFDRLGGAHFLLTYGLPSIGNLQPVTWFGIFAIGGLIIQFCTLAVARGRLETEERQSVTRNLVIFTLGRIGLMAGFALAGSFAWALAAYWAMGAVGAVAHPLYRAWLNQNIDSRVRATVLSLIGQADAVGQTAGGPIVGATAHRFSIRAGILLAAAFLSPLAAVYARARGSETERGNSETAAG
jgi:MFS family permease